MATVTRMEALVFFTPRGADRLRSVPADTALPAGSIVRGVLDSDGWHPLAVGQETPYEVLAAQLRHGGTPSPWELVDSAIRSGRCVVVAVDDGEVLTSVAELAHRHPEASVRVGGTSAPRAGVTVCSTPSPLWAALTERHEVRPGPGYRWVSYGPTQVARDRVATTAAVLECLVGADPADTDSVDIGAVVAAATGLDELDVWEAVAETMSPSTTAWLIANTSTPSCVLAAASSSSDPQLRAAVASHPNVALSDLELLAADLDAGVRMAVAANHSTPPELLDVLIGDSQELVVWAVLNNPAAPEHLLARDFGSPLNEFALRQALRRSAQGTPSDQVGGLLPAPFSG